MRRLPSVSRALHCGLICAALLGWPLVAKAGETPEGASSGFEKYGLLRERDLTPFGFLRLDMRPANASWGRPGEWGVEVLAGYQNTWALSPNVEQYLKSLPGRRQLGPAEVQAIRSLPGESYLVDLELGVLDVALHRQVTDHWSVNATLSAVHYGGGFMDGPIEDFHKAFGLDSFGRPAVARNNTNVILNLKGIQSTRLNALPEGGVLDPTFGLRYSLAGSPSPWNLVLESAIKVPVGGERSFLSTGNTDVGVQATLQRFAGRHAGYVGVALVRTQGSALTTSDRVEFVPTYLFGYEYSVTQKTGVIAQLYVSPSVLTHDDTDIAGLIETKYQLSLGVRHRIGASVVSFALTENTGHINNTPDIGFQLGWDYSPSFMR